MQIETYEIEEVKGELGNMAADSEAMELCKKLGLSGQIELTDSPTETRFPYPVMTTAQRNVYGIMCNQKTEIEKYRAGIIPIRVLQVAAFCREQPLIKKLEIWHPRIVKDDPILVGWDSSSAPYSGNAYLLARWGEHLDPFEVLVEKAKPIWKAQAKQMLDGMKRKIAGWEEDLENIATEVLTVGRDFTPNLYD